MKNLLFSVIFIGFLCAGCTAEHPRIRAASAEKPLQVKLLKPRAVIILENAMKSQDARLRTNAIEVAVKTRQKDMLPLITKLTTDPLVPVRFSATVALGDMRCFSCENLLRQSLNDPDVNVRIAGAYSLVKLNKPQYLQQLQAAVKSSNQKVRANAVWLLGKVDKREYIGLLYEVLEAKDSSDKVRLNTVEAIARLGDERMYRSKLWALQISKFADDRVVGIQGMGALNTAESRDAIATMLQDDVPEVRLAAAEQLARLGDNRGEGLVLEYFQTSPDLNTADIANGMAVMAIGYLKNNQLNPFLTKAMDSQAPYIQLLAAQSVLIQLL